MGKHTAYYHLRCTYYFLSAETACYRDVFILCTTGGRSRSSSVQERFLPRHHSGRESFIHQTRSITRGIQRPSHRARGRGAAVLRMVQTQQTHV